MSNTSIGTIHEISELNVKATSNSNSNVSSVSLTSNSERTGTSNNTSGCISKSETVDGGYNKTNEYLRSVLIHPIGLPLMAYLNGSKEFETIAEKFIPNFDKEPFPNNEENFYVNILKDAMCEGWDKKEKSLNKDICNRVLQAFKEGGKRVKENQGSVSEIRTDEHEKTEIQQQEEERAMEDQQQVNKKQWRVDGECHVKSNNSNKKKGYSDMLLSLESSAVAQFEFGLQNEIWWQKHHQNIVYAGVLLDNKEKKDKEKNNVHLLFNKPMLLVTTTIQNKPPYSSQFGVFLCTKIKDSIGYRMALLWRTTTSENIADASNVFGKIIYASVLCAKWRELCEDSNFIYTYLGPSCCRIKNELYRCYDNRLRPTLRSPNYYISIEKSKTEKTLYIPDIPDNNNETQPQLGDFEIKFEDELNNNEKLNWLWQFKGNVLIICTTFHVGVHYAKRPHHFLPIVKALAKLHEAGYVHGDIRAFNMVLQCDESKQGGGSAIDRTASLDGKEAAVVQSIENLSIQEDGLCKTDAIIPLQNIALDDHCKPSDKKEQERELVTVSTACPPNVDKPKSIDNAAARDDFATETNNTYGGYLIDFDMSGKQGEVRYPKGYNFFLPDGMRAGKVDALVRFYDDWYALLNIIFIWHELICPDDSIQSILDREKNKCYKTLKESFDLDAVATSLTEFLNQATTHNCELVPARDFQEYLKDNKMWDKIPYNTNNQSAKTNVAPTGSPNKPNI